jgi:multiple sugar transport system permease protein
VATRPVAQRLPLRRARQRPTARARGDRRAAVVLLAPAAGLLALWFLYPIVDSVILSFQSVNEFNYSDRHFIGLHNFSQLLHDPAFGQSLRITLVFIVVVVPVQTVLSLVLASVLQSIPRGKAIFRTAFFVPYMTSTVAVTTVFMRLFAQGGPLANLAAHVGVPNTTWYANIHLALPFLIIVYVYMYVGLYIVTFVAGMENIPGELYEAAVMDGAGAIARFRYVTVPSLRPYVVFVLIAGMIQAIQIFDQAYVVSGGTVLGSPAGATSTLVVFIYQQAFRLNALGYGSAAAVVLLVIVVVLTALTRRLVPERETA